MGKNQVTIKKEAKDSRERRGDGEGRESGNNGKICTKTFASSRGRDETVSACGNQNQMRECVFGWMGSIHSAGRPAEKSGIADNKERQYVCNLLHNEQEAQRKTQRMQAMGEKGRKSDGNRAIDKVAAVEANHK